MQAPESRIAILSAGLNLRGVRERLGLTMREVESASFRIAERHQNDEFAVSPSRLSDIETKGLVPSIFRLYSLAVIYRCDLRELLTWYGIDLSLSAADLHLNLPPRSHLSETLQGAPTASIPLRLDPAFDPRRSANLSRMVEQWGMVPLACLANLSQHKYIYGYVGSEDFTMHPLLPPGTFLQVDETRTKIEEGMWRSELERPIYFVETREGYICCWCSLKGEQIILQSHPLSPVAARALRHPQEAEVIGQVVGIALKLGEWQTLDALSESKPETKERAALN
jgi:transcriptional regulator with XRE-family HTH domain